MLTWKLGLGHGVSWCLTVPRATNAAGCKELVRQQDGWKMGREYNTAVWTLAKQHLYSYLVFFVKVITQLGWWKSSL